MSDPDLPEKIYVRELDGVGSLHVCCKDDPGAIVFVPATLLAEAEARGAAREREPLEAIIFEFEPFLARLRDWLGEHLTDESARDWVGHVEPNLERVGALINAKIAEDQALAHAAIQEGGE